jgi:hypothetical protein
MPSKALSLKASRRLAAVEMPFLTV